MTLVSTLGISSILLGVGTTITTVADSKNKRRRYIA